MTAEELARYRRSLDEAAARARSYVLRRLSEEGAGLGVAESRDLAIEVVEDATGVFGDQAQEVASELFDEVMEADGAEARATSFDGLIDHGRTEGKVHYYAGRIEAGDRAGFEARSADLAAYYVHRSAWENLVRNCDLNHVMWARVPTGRETCPYCLQLASRGFAYHTRDTASHGKHRGCDCVVVPGNKDASIEGYDPDRLKDLLVAADAEKRIVRYGVGAKSRDDYEIEMPGGIKSRFVKDSEIDANVAFAGKGSVPFIELRVRYRLSDQYGDDPDNWSHVSGEGWIFDPMDGGRIKRAEVHWMEAPDAGMHEFYFKRWAKGYR